MRTSSLRITVSSVVGAALLCLMPHATGFAQSYTIRPTCKPKDQCKPNTENFGYNDTVWRQWPGQERPEGRNPGTIGGKPIPTPPAVLEQVLPPAESLPARPAQPGGSIEGMALPLPQPGSATTPESPKSGGRNGTGPSNPNPGGPAGQNLQPPAAQGLPGIREGLDFAPPSRTPGQKRRGPASSPRLPPRTSPCRKVLCRKSLHRSRALPRQNRGRLRRKIFPRRRCRFHLWTNRRRPLQSRRSHCRRPLQSRKN